MRVHILAELLEEHLHRTLVSQLEVVASQIELFAFEFESLLAVAAFAQRRRSQNESDYSNRNQSKSAWPGTLV